MENKAFGIDLGTTYSCISYVDDISGEPVVVDNMEGTSVTPSVVYFEDDEHYVVGDVAKESAVVAPENTCEFVKRRMGEDSVAITVNDKDYSPSQISALILKKLVHDAQEALDVEIKDVVITCPAYFGAAHKLATKNAGEMAGLNVLQIINEPTAAALCYGSLSATEDKTILVYDLGGGTFDVTIIRVTPKEIVAIATDGDHQLGGKNWDDELMNYLEDEFRDMKDFDGDFDLEAQQDLRLKAEKAKQQLTAKEKTKVIVQAEGVKASIEVTRGKFDEITTALLRKTIEKTNDAIEAAKKKGCEKIDEIILVGGSCKMPQVKVIVEENYPGVPIKMFEPNYAVAKGAALHANNLLKGIDDLKRVEEQLEDIIDEINDISDEKVTIEDVQDGNVSEELIEKIADKIEEKGGTREEFDMFLGGASPAAETVVLRDITSKSFGIEVLSREVDAQGNRISKIANLINKQDEVPIAVTREFGTAYANMDNVEIKLYETDIVEDIYDIGTYEPIETAVLDLPPSLPEGSPIEIKIELTPDGMLQVTAVDKVSGKEIHIEHKSDVILSEEEVKQQTEELKGLILN